MAEEPDGDGCFLFVFFVGACMWAGLFGMIVDYKFAQHDAELKSLRAAVEQYQGAN